MKTKSAPPGILRRCENPNCHNLTDSGRFCSIKCARTAPKEVRTCACGCGRTFTPPRKNPTKRYFNPDCAAKGRTVRTGPEWDHVRENERAGRRRVANLLGPSEPLFKPWEKKKVTPRMTDAQQARIDREVNIKLAERSMVVPSVDVLRRMGAAV